MRWQVARTKESEPASTVEDSRGKAEPTRSGEVLVLNRDPELRLFLNKALFAGNLSYTSVSSGTEAQACLRRNGYSSVVVGIDSPESVAFLESAHAEFPGVPLVAVARVATPELVRDILRAGAADFLFGSLDVRAFGPRLAAIMGAAPEGGHGEKGAPRRRSGREATRAAEREPRGGGRLGAEAPERTEPVIVCRNKKMRRILEIAETVAPTDSTVLVQGESGTGKELIARRIHLISKRKDKPFVEVNCGALPESLLESQLFGHEKGSFTGAVHRQVGLFEIADGGTLFLDEIGEMSPDMQVKLLRVIQFKEFRRVGGSQIVRSDVRVIAATNKDLAAEVAQNRFRPDLFYRINVISLSIPPLRERLEEVPELVARFCETFARERNVPQKIFSPAAMETLQKYRWAGNVRELENTVERAILLSKEDEVDAEDLKDCLDSQAEMAHESAFVPTLTLDEVKRIHIGNVLHQNGGNKMKTARILQINVKTLYNLMKRLDIK